VRFTEYDHVLKPVPSQNLACSIGRIDEHSNASGRGHQLTQQCQPLCTNSRDGVLAKLKCSMRAVQSYPFRKLALQVLPDRSRANAAFVAWYAPFQIKRGKRERHRDNLSRRLGFRCSERTAPERLRRVAGNQRQNPLLGEGCGGVPRPCALRTRRLIGVDMCNSPLRLRETHRNRAASP
jgi:hypothetical protein